MLDVIILGAGVSGLRAAQVLQEQYGHSVAVLEARPTAGGRIRWTSFPSSENDQESLYIDEGAQFIHGLSKRHPIQNIAKEAGVPFRAVDWDDGYVFVGPHGQELASAVERREEKAVEKILTQVWHWQQTASSDMSLHDVLAPLVDRQCARDSRLNAQRLWTNLQLQISDDYGNDLDKISARYYNQDSALSETDAQPKTFQKVVEAMLPQDEATIRYQHVVENVCILNPDLVKVTCRHAVTNEHIELQARRVICTLPFGVLRQKADTLFSPPLPAPFQTSLQRIGYGCLEKVWLQFNCDEPFWPRDADVFYHMASATPFRMWFLPERVYLHPSSRDIQVQEALAYSKTLCCFVSGDAARMLGHLSPREVAAQALAALKQILPVPELEDNDIITNVHVTRWSQDPWSGNGSYSHMTVGTTPDDFRVWESGAHDNVLWFAGEATSVQYLGTVHGAYWSGERAAIACHKSLVSE